MILPHDPLADEEHCPACQAGQTSVGFRPYDHDAVTKHRPRDFHQQVERLIREYPKWWNAGGRS